VQKHLGATPAATVRQPSTNAAIAGNGGARQRQNTVPAARAGTVKLVDGTTVYVTMSDGEVVTVRTNASTAVQTVQSGSLAQLTPGAQVSVEGPADADGTVTATKLTRTGP
jgi:hypothetical protein